MWFKGLRPGTIVYEFSDTKNRAIEGVIIRYEGDSVNMETYSFKCCVRFFEPIKGNDPRYYNEGWYSEQDLEGMLESWVKDIEP